MEQEHHSVSIIYHLLGIFSSICFGFQYVPQMFLNYNRRSVQGFSEHSIIIKLIGASFLFINSSLTGEAMAVVFYGFINVLQHTIFMFQFSMYSKEARTTNILLWIAFPFVPYLIGYLYPNSMYITNSIKPLTQLFSHLPQVFVCIKSKSTMGVSLSSQYLNFIGGIAGVIMCIGIPPVSFLTYFIYINSVIQALSIFIMYYYYDYRNNNGGEHLKTDDISIGNNNNSNSGSSTIIISNNGDNINGKHTGGGKLEYEL